MKSSFLLPRACAAALFAAVLALGLAGPYGFQAVKAGSPPSEIVADYKVTLAGFDVGAFRYVASVDDGVYTLSSDVELSLFLGAFKWKGLSRTVGKVAGGKPSPVGFNFNFESSLKNGAVRIGFDRGAVKTVAIEPVPEPTADLVPVKREHLKGVMDPLTAIMALTKGGGNPCDRQVAIFDGRQRFDLRLAFRRVEPLNGGQPGTVCMISYKPISGYRATAETSAMAESTGIEITFRPVKGADLNVPQRVVLPTLAGMAEITIERLRIKPVGRGQLAYVD